MQLIKTPPPAIHIKALYYFAAFHSRPQFTAQPVITPPPASVTGSESVPVVLPCEITPLDGLQVLRWQKDGVNIVVSNSARYTGGTVLNPSLTILTPSDADSGSYRCVATNQYGTTAGGDFTLDIQYKPRLTVEDDPISTNPGPSVSLTCQVDANPAPNVLFWTKRGVGPIVSSGSNKYLGGTPANPTLTIINANISDAGEYYCTVSNSQGTTESPAVDLNVITSPDVNIFPPSAVVEEGLQNLVLGCTVVASPPAQLVAWTKDGIVIDTASGTTTSGSGPKYAGGTTQSPSLTIFDVRRTDAGLYACVATNTEGVGTSPNLRVDVTYLPTLTVPSSSVVGGRESSITLTCGVEAFPPLISLRWVKDGSQDIDLTQQTTLGQNKYSGGTAAVPDLTIRDLNETIDTGVYRCVAENSRGSVTSDPVNVAVTFDPVVNVPTSVTSREGQTFTITCNVQMFPAANSLIWYKDNVEFDPAATPSKYQGGTLGVPSLTVLNPTGSDSGTYNCRASNNQGVDITSSDIPVAVIFSPKITTSTDLVTRDQGQSVTLDVTVEATPTPSRIQWQTSDIDGASSTRTDLNIGGRISGGTISNPSITITNAQPSDAAFYYIIVTNDEGSTTAGPIPFRVRCKYTD
ncbi:hemicentin 1 [Plakobranchus ocellatus]|uniref:Hemicentin 1 n=1 Tax=Plakobranchus ocellatus TaxID=259542 RepID=A0AAV4A6M6_9GAST|nr:hemicentin 1 [Plakobranchus ocellatus]